MEPLSAITMNTQPNDLTHTRSEPILATHIKELILQLSHTRGPHKTFCPSEVARCVDDGDWRKHMSLVREVATELWEKSLLGVFQKGKCVDPHVAKGPIRYGLPR